MNRMNRANRANWMNRTSCMNRANRILVISISFLKFFNLNLETLEKVSER
ncbi:hypothetical protein HMPREF3230_00828 [Gardnerella vaginalis]|uniref:Uncharacterized protein n=1 Tax=Gardnerella vaginalis TaxID=2702 RepID=A0A135Z5M9_GARVA|nr:hypothetical protein HMPREF3230_00828 [Gardnerella vaginalis]